MKLIMGSYTMVMDEFVYCLDAIFLVFRLKSWTGMSKNEWVLDCYEFCRFWAFSGVSRMKQCHTRMELGHTRMGDTPNGLYSYHTQLPCHKCHVLVFYV